MLHGDPPAIGVDNRRAGEPITDARAAIDQLGELKIGQQARGDFRRVDVAPPGHDAGAAFCLPVVEGRAKDLIAAKVVSHAGRQSGRRRMTPSKFIIPYSPVQWRKSGPFARPTMTESRLRWRLRWRNFYTA